MITRDEFIRRFLAHVLPRGFHRIQHYGILAGSARKTGVALARQLLDVAPSPDDARNPSTFRSFDTSDAPIGSCHPFRSSANGWFVAVSRSERGSTDGPPKFSRD